MSPIGNKINTTLISTQKIDNGDGSYTINETYQFVNTRVIKVADIETQINILQEQLIGLPVNAVPAQQLK